VAAAEPQLTRWRVAGVAALAAGALSACGQPGESATGSPAGSAEPSRRVPAEVERQVHQAFHRFDRYCSRRKVDEPALDRTTSDFIGWYRTYPAENYAVQIDDEPGTMLSAILVLRYELSRCSPRHAARIDAVLPRKMLRGLRPLPETSR
jgi:hypothetical protein